MYRHLSVLAMVPGIVNKPFCCLKSRENVTGTK
jgi:hypothetical protein